jgi:hypothetical protein
MRKTKTIAICGSMMFAKEMLKAKKELESRGLKVHIQEDIEDFTKGKRTNENKWRKIKLDPLKNYFKVIKKVDSILVVNHDKNDIKNYIGSNTLIEMAFAYVLEKKIFLMNSIPKMSCTDEIALMKPIVIKSKFDRILNS